MEGRPFGNQYLKGNTAPLFNTVFHCMTHNNCSYESPDENQTFHIASEIAQYLYTLKDSKSKTYKPDFTSYNGSFILQELKKFNEDQKKANIDVSLKRIFQSVLNNIEKREAKPYMSITYLTTNDLVHINRAQNTLNIIENILEDTPDLSLEIIQFYIKNNNTQPFTKMLNVSRKVASHLHVIEIENEEFIKLIDVFGTKKEMIPEYFFRNVGTRLGQGNILMTGSEDVYPSMSFFHIAQRHLDSPFVQWRSMRGVIRTPNNPYDHYKRRQGRTITILDKIKDNKFVTQFMWSNGPTGDFQGAPRMQMFALNGWPWGSYVYYADTAFHMDQRAFKVPPYELKLYGSMHQQHKAWVFNSPYFKIDNGPPERRVQYCEGYPSAHMNHSIRPNWGVSYDYPTNDDRYGHLIYSITPKSDSNKPWISQMSFTNIINDKQWEA